LTKAPDRIEVPAAWYGEALAQTPDVWTWQLRDSDIAELVEAAKAFIDSEDALSGITCEAFSLPRLGPRLQRLAHELKSGLGFALLTGFPSEVHSRELNATVFCGLGAHLGHARSQNAAGHILGHVKDLGADAQDVNARIYQTSARQTFHTDSSDVVGLLCLREAKEGGESLLVSTITIYNEMMARRPDLASRLFEPVATDRRGEVPPGELPYFLIPVLNWHDGALTGIYQRQYIESAQRFEGAPRLNEHYIEALDLFDALANDPALHLKMRLAPGDMQFVYNHTNLHDRTGFTDWPEPEQRRHLLRLWLSLPDDRTLPPVFAERYGSVEVGNRGGILVEGTRLVAPLSP